MTLSPETLSTLEKLARLLHGDTRYADVFADALDAALAALRAQPQRGTDWQPMETVPRDGTTVIGALIRDGKVWRIFDMRHNGLAFYTTNGGSVPNPTHWCAMPPACS